MKKISIAIAAFCLLGAVAVAGEYYKYVDENGVVRFTDDFNQIPPALQQQAEKYSGVAATATTESGEVPSTTPEPPAPQPAQEALPATAAPVAAADAGDPTPPADLETWRQQLEGQKRELDTAQAGLTEEMTALESQKEKAKSKAEIKAYNDRVIELNRKIEAYENERLKLNEAVRSYNEKAAASGSRTP